MKDGELYKKFKEHYYNNKLVELFKELKYEWFNKDMIYYSESEAKKSFKLYLVDNYKESQLYIEYIKSNHSILYTNPAHK
jgi:nicotinamide mononucleotide adenylyltransferase